MASSFHFIALCSLLFISASLAKTPLFKPKAFILPVTKDPETFQYLTEIKQRTPLVSLSLTVDLGGRYLWTDCQNGYVSSTYRFFTCKTSECKLSGENTFCNTCDSPPGPACHNNSCSHFALNPIAYVSVPGELTSDVISIRSTDGKNPTRGVSMPKFFFFCTDNNSIILSYLAKGVTGIAGFGRTHLSISSQFARFFNYSEIFAMCLSPSSKGVIFLGDGPYTFFPNVNVASSLTYTPLLDNRGKKIEQLSSSYYIGVTSIKVNGQVVPINTTLLSIDENGYGGTKISTTDPYTVLETSIYNAVVKAFVSAINVTRVPPVESYRVCYSSKSFGRTRVGPAVPPIDFVLQSEEVYWRISGENLMVQVSKDVMCLGLLTLGLNPAITIGGHELENHLLQFNVAKSRLGFSSSLLHHQTSCANFNFTSTAYVRSFKQ